MHAAFPSSHTSPYIPHIFIYSLKIYTITQNLVSISSSNRFFIARSNTVGKQKAVWQRARQSRWVGIKGGAGHWKDWRKWRQQAQVFLFIIQNTTPYRTCKVKPKRIVMDTENQDRATRGARVKSPTDTYASLVRNRGGWCSLLWSRKGPQDQRCLTPLILAPKQGNWEVRSEEKCFITEAMHGPQI